MEALPSFPGLLLLPVPSVLFSSSTNRNSLPMRCVPCPVRFRYSWTEEREVFPRGAPFPLAKANTILTDMAFFQLHPTFLFFSSHGDGSEIRKTCFPIRQFAESSPLARRSFSCRFLLWFGHLALPREAEFFLLDFTRHVHAFTDPLHMTRSYLACAFAPASSQPNQDSEVYGAIGGTRGPPPSAAFAPFVLSLAIAPPEEEGPFLFSIIGVPGGGRPPACFLNKPGTVFGSLRRSPSLMPPFNGGSPPSRVTTPKAARAPAFFQGSARLRESPEWA